MISQNVKKYVDIHKMRKYNKNMKFTICETEVSKVTLAGIRARNGKTVEDMSEFLNISPSSYSFYENGKRKVPKNIAERIALYLNVSVSDIFLPSTFTICENNMSKGKSELSEQVES